MAVYAALTTAPNRWRYAEARHFTSVLNMSFEEYDENLRLLGAARIEQVVLRNLHRRAAECPSARAPEELWAAWQQALIFRRTPERAKVPLCSQTAVLPDVEAPAVSMENLEIPSSDEDPMQPRTHCDKLPSSRHRNV